MFSLYVNCNLVRVVNSCCSMNMKILYFERLIQMVVEIQEVTFHSVWIVVCRISFLFTNLRLMVVRNADVCCYVFFLNLNLLPKPDEEQQTRTSKTILFRATFYRKYTKVEWGQLKEEDFSDSYLKKKNVHSHWIVLVIIYYSKVLSCITDFKHHMAES